jgi:hypothetical protein
LNGFAGAFGAYDLSASGAFGGNAFGGNAYGGAYGDYGAAYGGAYGDYGAAYGAYGGGDYGGGFRNRVATLFVINHFITTFNLVSVLLTLSLSTNSLFLTLSWHYI